MYHFDLSDDDTAAIGAMLWPDLIESMTDSSNTLVPKVVHEDLTTGVSFGKVTPPTTLYCFVNSDVLGHLA